jgi:tRNA A37 N6-isopentenylltransferase MiaA
MNTPNIDLLLSDITFRRGRAAQVLEVTVHDGDDTRFDAVSIVDLIDEVRALQKERDETRKERDAAVAWQTAGYLQLMALYKSTRTAALTQGDA